MSYDDFLAIGKADAPTQTPPFASLYLDYLVSYTGRQRRSEITSDDIVAAWPVNVEPAAPPPETAGDTNELWDTNFQDSSSESEGDSTDLFQHRHSTDGLLSARLPPPGEGGRPVHASARPAVTLQYLDEDDEVALRTVEALQALSGTVRSTQPPAPAAPALPVLTKPPAVTPPEQWRILQPRLTGPLASILAESYGTLANAARDYVPLAKPDWLRQHGPVVARYLLDSICELEKHVRGQLSAIQHSCPTPASIYAVSPPGTMDDAFRLFYQPFREHFEYFQQFAHDLLVLNEAAGGEPAEPLFEGLRKYAFAARGLA